MSNIEVLQHTEEQQSSEHAERVKGAFVELEQKLGERSSEEVQRIQGLKKAAIMRDRAGVEKHLEAAKYESNWLYEELMKHPEVSAIMRELSIMGF